MLVRTLKAHSNGLGKSYENAVGDEYDHPSPDLLIARGKLEAVDGSQVERLPGTGKKPSQSAKGNKPKRAAKGGKGRARANGGRGGAKGS